MVYVATFLFVLGLFLLGARVYSPLKIGHPRILTYAGMGAVVTISLSCLITAYVGIFVKSENVLSPVQVSGDFGMSGGAADNIQRDHAGMAADNSNFSNNSGKASSSAENSDASKSQNPFDQMKNSSGAPSVFSLAQAAQICEGFSEIAIGALIAGAKNEPYAPYEEKAKRMAEQMMRLPFVREAGTKPVQYLSSLFPTLIEDQYYISPQNRAIQMGLINKVDRKMALEAMSQACQLKILEIRTK